MEKNSSAKEIPATSTLTAPQTTTEPPLRRRKPAKTTTQDLQSTPTSTSRPKTSKTTTRLPEFVHMPTVKFDFGSSSFHPKGNTRRTDTRADLYKDRINESQKENFKESTWPTGNEIEKKDVKSDIILLSQKEQVENKIGSSNIPVYSSKARFNDKADSMFAQAASNR